MTELELYSGDKLIVDDVYLPVVSSYKWFQCKSELIASTSHFKAKYIKLLEIITGVIDPRIVLANANGNIFDCRLSNISVEIVPCDKRASDKDGVSFLNGRFQVKKTIGSDIYIETFETIQQAARRWAELTIPLYIAISEAPKLKLKKPKDKTRVEVNVSKGRGKPIICLDSGKIYKNLTEAALDCDIQISNLSAHLHGRLPHVGELQFKYV